MNYIATFFTHASALITNRTLTNLGVRSRLAPVPRALSSSCGTCVMYEADDPHLEHLDRDAEGVYEITETSYRQLKKYE